MQRFNAKNCNGVTAGYGGREGNQKYLMTYYFTNDRILCMCISFFKMFNILFLRKVDLAQKNLVLPEEKFVSLMLHRNAITLQHLIIQFPLFYPSSDHLREVKSKRSEAVPSIMI